MNAQSILAARQWGLLVHRVFRESGCALGKSERFVTIANSRSERKKRGGIAWCRWSTKYRMNSRDSPTRYANRGACRSQLRRMQFATATTERRAQSSDSTELQTPTRSIALPPTRSIALPPTRSIALPPTRSIEIPPTRSIALQQFSRAIVRCPSSDSSLVLLSANDRAPFQRCHRLLATTQVRRNVANVSAFFTLSKLTKNGARGKWLNLRRLIEMERLLQHRRPKHLAR